MYNIPPHIYTPILGTWSKYKYKGIPQQVKLFPWESGTPKTAAISFSKDVKLFEFLLLWRWVF